jgi:hypothetical protein
MPLYCNKDLSYYPQNRPFFPQCFHISPNNIYPKESLEIFFAENFITQNLHLLSTIHCSLSSLSLSHGSHLALDIKRGNMSENLPI